MAARKRLSAAEEVSLSSRVHIGDRSAFHVLINSNQGLVIQIARQMCRGVDLEDCVSEGNIGLCIAAERFDGSRGCRFSTYAAFWIRSYIGQYLQRSRFCVSGLLSSNSNRQAFVRLARARRESGTEVDVLRRADVSEDLARAFRAGSIPIRIDDGKIEEDRSQALVDDKPGPAASYELRSSAEELRRRVARAVDRLPERERHIVRRRYLTDSPCTLESLGQELGGISRERIRQLEQRALAKIKQRLGGRDEP